MGHHSKLFSQLTFARGLELFRLHPGFPPLTHFSWLSGRDLNALPSLEGVDLIFSGAKSFYF